MATGPPTTAATIPAPPTDPVRIPHDRHPAPPVLTVANATARSDATTTCARVLVSAPEGDRSWMVAAFRLEGYVVLAVPSGSAVHAAVVAGDVDIAVLHNAADLMLADLSRVHAAGTVPVIVHLRDAGTSAEVFLEAGADDCVPSGVSSQELLARVRAILRRPHRTDPREVLRLGPFCLDTERHLFRYDGTPMHLPPKEFALLELLMRRQGRLVDRAEILDLVWGVGRTGDPKTVDVHVKRLREKLEPVPSKPRHLLTVRGRGYRLEG